MAEGLDDIMLELEDCDDEDMAVGDDRIPSFPTSLDITTDVPPAELPPSNEVPRGATIAVAGGGTAVGQSLLRALFASDNGWNLRALQRSKADAIGSLAGLGVKAVAASSAAELQASLEGVSALIIISSAAGGKGGIEIEEIKTLVGAIPTALRRVIFLSSHGVERTDQLPWSLQNAWGGPLDKLRAAEQEVVLRAMSRLPSYSVLRVGKLLDEAGLDGTAPSRAELAPGDALQGELTVSTASSVLVQSLTRSEAVNASFSAAPPGASPQSQGAVSAAQAERVHWDDQFLKLAGPEIYRRALNTGAGVAAADLAAALRDWALRFAAPGSGLTTPVELDDLPGSGEGIVLRFVQKNPNAGYTSFDQEETDDEKWAKAKSSQKQSKATPDGALYVFAEDSPYPRVRVVRAEMGEGVIVKPMSEAAILEALDKAAATLEKARA